MAKMVPVMHDLVEDTEITIEFLQNEGFSEYVLNALDCVANRIVEDYESFIEHIA